MQKSIKIPVLAIFATIMMLGIMQPVSAATPSEANTAAKAQYQKASDQYKKEVAFYATAKQKLVATRAKYAKLKNSDNRQALEDSTRAFLKQATQSLVARLEAIQAWADSRGSLTDAEKTEISTEIDADVAWLNAKSAEIDGASPVGMTNAAKDIRTYWGEHRGKIQSITGIVLASRAGVAIDKAESFSARLDTKIQALKADGQDTTGLESKLANFNEKVALAKDKYQAAKDSFNSASNAVENNSVFKQGNQFIKKSNQYLREAHGILKSIVDEMKSM